MQDKIDNEQVERKPGHTYWQWILTILANMTVFSYGLDVGWMSPMAKILQSELSPIGEPLSDTMLSWTASTICLGAVFSVPLYSYIADRFGSKASVIAIAIPQAISWLIRLCVASGPSLIISRTVSGFAAGGCFNAVVMYVKEISQDDIRGVLASMLILFQNSAVFTMYIMGAYFNYYTILWIVTGIPIVTGILLLKAPESPAFLVKQGKIEDAIATVAFLRGLNKDHKIVVNEITAMKNENDYFKSQPELSIINILKNPIWRQGMITSSIIIVIQATNGAFVVMTYASNILRSTGVKFNVSEDTLTLSLPAVMIMGSAMSAICMEKIGRRTLLVVMLSISSCSMLCLAISMLMKNYGVTVPGWLPMLSMMVSTWAFAGGISPMPFVIMAEMFNFQTRAKVFGLTVTLAWLATFIPVVGYMPLSNAVGFHTTFFIFTAINIVGAIFSMFFLPETRGKSVEQIEKDIAIRIGVEKVPNWNVT